MRATETPAAPVHHYVWLDALRAFPIIFVVLGHAFPVLLTGGADDSLASRVAGHVARTGGAAAVVLIVLSGYIVGGIVIRAGRSTDAWRFDLYALHRLTRLWNVLLPALVLGYIVDRGGIAIFGTAGIYGGKTSAAVFYPAERFLTGTMFMSNALFGGSIKSPAFGTNGALWTVNYEFWFYFMGAALLFAVFHWRHNSLARTATLLAIAVALAAWVGGDVLRYFTFWLAGAAASLAPLGRLRVPNDAARRTVLVLGAALTVAAVMIGDRNGTAGYTTHLGTALLAAFAMPLLVANEGHARRPGRGARIVVWLASISFSLYATHLPLMVFVRALLEHQDVSFRYSPVAVVVTGVVAVAAAIAFAAAFAQVTERRLPQMRAMVRRTLGALAQ